MVLTFSCSDHEYDNPYDPANGGYSYEYNQQRSSSSSYWFGISSSSSRPPSSSSVYLGTGGKGNNISNYKTVQIGTQKWMAENLNYDVVGSKCYDNLESNCNTYGRLYNWATAMALDASCNSSTCSSQVQAKHRGICPSGWHIPTYDEWKELESYIESIKSCSNCDAKHLKATDGWYSCSASGSSYSCLDTHGFAALPGGLGYSVGIFFNAGDRGIWWSASESNADYAYGRYMFYDSEYAYWSNDIKTYLFSVRCLQD
jgi:uncharacterized protein (TIGR02145 family)